MMILINILIHDMPLDLILVHFFQFQILILEKMPLFLSSSVHIDNKYKDIIVLGKGPTQGLDNTTLTAEAKYFLNFSRSQRKFCKSLL